MPRANDVADQVEHQEARTLSPPPAAVVEADGGGELCEVGGDAHGDLVLRIQGAGAAPSVIRATLAQTGKARQDYKVLAKATLAMDSTKSRRRADRGAH